MKGMPLTIETGNLQTANGMQYVVFIKYLTCVLHAQHPARAENTENTERAENFFLVFLGANRSTPSGEATPYAASKSYT